MRTQGGGGVKKRSNFADVLYGWPHIGLGPQNPTKKLTHLVDFLGHMLSRNCFSKFFDLGPPSLNCVSCKLVSRVQYTLFSYTN